MKSGLSDNILDAIGNTPMVEVEGIYCKLEYLNPSGSIKARIAKYMIERAEDEGLLRHGDTIVEATSGNTGNALSMVAAVKGYRMLVVMPEGMSGGPEILSQLPDGVVPDAIVMGVGTGGTLIGVGQAFREVNPAVKLFAMEPSESSTILCGEVGDHLIEGISDGFVPGIFQRHQGLVDTALTVDSEEAVEEMRRLARKYGLFVGPSSGANLIATRKVRESYPELETIITLFCDEGEKYISDHFAQRDSVRVGREAYT
jgi:cysteine synthase